MVELKGLGVSLFNLECFVGESVLSWNLATRQDFETHWWICTC